ncbi:MAG: hypothetical protein AUJ75_04240 [Candidatus Omnitrophica bacterium CG1_02_49_10]|nr:MAG: hypothetical protein AUJ75_04240 [Candidatus Omnitrophica bacterium CG1_02_49_10]
MRKRWLIFVLFLGTLLFTVAYFNIPALIRERILLEERKASFRALGIGVKEVSSAFSGEAGIVVRDMKGGYEIVIDGDKPFPSASLAKAPIMAAYLLAAEEGRVCLDETIRLKGYHKVGGSGVLKGVKTGKSFTVEQLMELMITKSDNAATNMLIERLGFDYLNDAFKRLGLRNTNISRYMMDFKKRSKGIENYTTANDVDLLLSDIYNGRLINKEVSDRCMGLLKEQKMADRIPARLPPSTVVAHKTGLEKGICHDAGIVFAPKGDFAVTVLTRHHNKDSRPSKKFISQIAFMVYTIYSDI